MPWIKITHATSLPLSGMILPTKSGDPEFDKIIISLLGGMNDLL